MLAWCKDTSIDWHFIAPASNSSSWPRWTRMDAIDLA
jgi:hypothetical protein